MIITILMAMYYIIKLTVVFSKYNYLIIVRNCFHHVVYIKNNISVNVYSFLFSQCDDYIPHHLQLMTLFLSNIIVA